MIARAGTASAGGGPSADYRASAVHFAITASLANASLVCSDSGKATCSVWIKATASSTSDGSGQPFFVSDPGGNYDTFLYQWDSGATPPRPNTFSLGFGGTSSAVYVLEPETLSVWLHWLASCDMTGATPLMAAYQSDSPVGQPFNFTGSFPEVVKMNGLPFYVGTDTFTNAVCDMSMFQFYEGVSIVESDNTISAANRRLFIDATGKPVDPVLAVSTLGSPTVLLNGTATTFATNQGTGGAFTTTGVLTNASTSPSD